MHKLQKNPWWLNQCSSLVLVLVCAIIAFLFSACAMMLPIGKQGMYGSIGIRADYYSPASFEDVTYTHSLRK